MVSSVDLGSQRDNAVSEVSFYTDVRSITSGMAITFNHGLPSTPRVVWLRLKCLTAELNYEVGDEVEFYAYTSSSSSLASATVACNSTQIKVKLETLPFIVDFGTGDRVAITADNWNLIVKAEI